MPRERQDEEDADEEGGEGDGNGEGSGGTGVSPRLMRMPDKTDQERHPSQQEAEDADEEFRFPDINSLDHEVLDNGYKLAEIGGLWLLYDGNDVPVGVFPTREAAIKKAFELLPPPQQFRM